MSKIRDDKQALDAFIRAHSYPAEDGLIVRRLMRHPVHARSDRGNAAAYFKFPGLRILEAHVSELPAGASATLHRHNCEALLDGEQVKHLSNSAISLAGALITYVDDLITPPRPDVVNVMKLSGD